MKVKGLIAALLAVLTLVAGAGLNVSITSTSAAVPPLKNHAVNVQFTGSTAVGAHPDVTNVLSLCTDLKGLAGGTVPANRPAGETNNHECAATSPATPFFDQATALFTGVQVVPQLAGARIAQISFDIETNGGVIQGAGVDNGQPAPCGAVTHILAPAFTVWAGAKTGAPVSMDPAGMAIPYAGFAQDQVDDPAQAGVLGTDADPGNGWPKGVTQVPSIQPAVQTLIGFPDVALLNRGYGVAVVAYGVAQTSVTFLAIATGGNPGVDPIANVTVLGNPFGAANSTSVKTRTCPPFTSSVLQRGTSLASSGSQPINPGAAPLVGPGDTLGVAGAPTLTVCGGACSVHAYDLLLSSSGDDDGDGVTNAADNCPTVPNPTQAGSFAGIGAACANGEGYANNDPAVVARYAACKTGGNPVAIVTGLPCSDIDGDGFLNAVDNCPFVANPLQTNFDGDSRGDACEGDGTNPNQVAGSGTNATNAAASVRGDGSGLTIDHDDRCNTAFTPGGSLTPPTTCLAFTAAAGPALVAGDLGAPGPCTACLGPGITYQDSNDDGVPDFLATGATTVIRDHKADSNNDGYSDADQGSPANCGVGGGCSSLTTKGTAETGTCNDAGTSCGTGVITPLRIARIAPNDGGTGCLKLRDNSASGFITANLAKADVDLDGSISILDLSVVAGWFNNSVGDATDPRWEGNMDGDGSISILDLSAMADVFNRSVNLDCKVQ